MENRRPLRAGGNQGQATLFVTLSLPVLFGLLGLCVDLGWAYWRREACKIAAESAASAVTLAAGSTAPGVQGDTTCPSSPSSSTAWQVGCLFAQQNGFTNGSNGQTVSIQVGSGSTGIPVSGVSPNNYWVSATVSETIPTLFSRVLGRAGMTVTSRATAAVWNAGGGGGGCVYVMDPSAHHSYIMTGGNVTTGCGIYVDSSQSDATYMTGGNLTLNSSYLTIHGGLSKSGGNISPSGNVRQNQPSFTNPFSGMTPPTPAANCSSDPNITGGNTNNISPGTYCGITVSGGNNVLFGSGVYILKTGNLTISGGNFSTTTTNVLFYIPSSNSSGKINITGGNMHWSGISGNGADGFVFWVDNSAAQNITGGNYTINGVTYMPNSALTYTGGNGTQQTLVVDTLSITGGNITSSAPSSYFSGGSGGLSGPYMVE